MTTIVFSKDRAMQLEAFLRSYRDHVMPLGEVHVLYTSSPRHDAAYQTVFETYGWVVPCRQVCAFKEELLPLIPMDGYTVFFVDDQVFIRPWEKAEISGLSLRHGLHLTRNYASNDAPQSVPLYQVLDDGRVSWRWAEGEEAWSYPLSLDGHIYDAGAMRAMVEELDVYSPNTLESGLQRFAPYFMQRYGTCYPETKAVNVPWNIVQTDWYNRHACNASPDEMLSYWEAGKRIDLRGIYGVLNVSVHQEFPLVLEAR